jgi:nicotinamide-nucleotide adenylyltransferase
MKALYIGRFQPFHNGHLLVVQKLSEEYEEIIIGIGSSQDSNSSDNPFSEKERIEMIDRSLECAGIHNYRVVSIPDIHNPPRWVSHVRTIISDFDVVIANNPFTRKLFSEKGYMVKGTAYFEGQRYSGKEIRRCMIHDESWEDLVPDAVVKIIKDIHGVQRIKDIARQKSKN